MEEKETEELVKLLREQGYSQKTTEEILNWYK